MTRSKFIIKKREIREKEERKRNDETKNYQSFNEPLSDSGYDAHDSWHSPCGGAESTHTHCICAKTAEAAGSSSIGDHTAHTDITFTAWTDTLAAEQNGEGKTAANSLPSVAGNYYLTSDVTLTETWKPTDNTVLCLGGYEVSITLGKYTIYTEVICVEDGIEFTLTDCSTEQGKIKGINHDDINQTLRIKGAGNFAMYGGSIEGTGSDVSHPIFGIQMGDNDDNKTAQFNMYGGSIANVRTGIRVRDTLNIYGGSISNCSEYGVEFNNLDHTAVSTMSSGIIHDCGCGVAIYGINSTFNMSGGSIKNNGKDVKSNYKPSHRGAVDSYISPSTFNMSGGTIEENINDKDSGAGVSSGTFNMSGGSIKNNIGGGVHASNITISGTAQITDNKLNDKTTAENLYIYSDKTIKVESLSETAKIGITTKTVPTVGSPVTFTSNAVSDYAGKLFSDNAAYEISTNDNRTLALKLKKVAPTLTTIPTATASYGQKLSEITLTNPSGNTDGTWQWTDGTQSVGNVTTGASVNKFKAKFIPSDTDTYTTVENIEISVTVNPKSLTDSMIKIDGTQPTYTGSAHDAKFNVYDGETPLEKGTDYKIVSGEKATNVETTTLIIEGLGNYTGTATATWSLKKAEASADDFNITAPEKVKYGAAVNVVTPTVKNGIVGMGNVDKVYYVGTGDTRYTKSETAPTEVGSYAVTFDVAEGENYTATSGLEIGVLTIEKATGGDGGGAGGGAVFVPNVEKPEITVDETQGKVELSSDGTTATVKPKDGYEIDSITVNGKDQGTADKITGLKTGDTVIVTFKKKDDSSDLTGEIADIQAKLSKIQLVARSAKTSKKNTKITIKTDEETQGFIKALNSSGYDVKYKYYRSTKKSAKYVAKVTKSGKSYINTSGKIGSMYYYKARLQVCDANGRLIAQTALKQCKYANRQWSKQ